MNIRSKLKSFHSKFGSSAVAQAYTNLYVRLLHLYLPFENCHGKVISEIRLYVELSWLVSGVESIVITK